MCGIAGYIAFEGDVRAQTLGALAAMTGAIRRRGPDDEGHWRDQECGLGLGMRRLAVIDLSPAGRQPMISECGRFVLVFNGEIYNHKALRAELDRKGQAPDWRGRSDTEVLLAAIVAWGLAPALLAANGMFGLALWDRASRKLELACDRFGEKPVYYGWQEKTFLFGSELKALYAHPSWIGAIDPDALTLYFRNGYIPAPFSIYKGIRKLLPGSIISVKAGGALGRAEQSQYWSAYDAVSDAKANPLDISESEATQEFGRVLSNAVGLRMEADVPLGAFLSGGFDSTAVVAAMQMQSSRPVQTFTIGFTEKAYDEAPFARAVAQHLGTDHAELYVSPKQAMDVIPKLPELYDEPFADSSQIPTYLVSEAARRHVTVALSGDGGDELFGGYGRYFVANRFLPLIARSPATLRKGVASIIRGVGGERWDSIYRSISLGAGQRLVGDRALKFADLLSSGSLLDGYHKVVSIWPEPDRLVSGGQEPSSSLPGQVALPKGLSFIEQMMFLDLVTYLPGDILTKVDRATMGVSLEGRIPFLDHRVMEFAWRLPLRHKILGGKGKRVVRNFVYGRVPKALMDRPKTGFGVPIQRWLRGPLRGWAEELLFHSGANNLDALIDRRQVGECWMQHLEGSRNWQARLWSVLVLSAWLQHQQGHTSAKAKMAG